MATHSCAVCGTPTFEAQHTIQYQSVAGPVTLYDVPVQHCSACGEDALMLSSAPQLQSEIALALARKTVRLDPREVRFLREHVGLSRAQLADAFGAPLEAANRWEDAEAPELMSLQAERLLRVMVMTGDPPDAV
jgi:putative zinc finger/helix-turn-helix YgiT family protein